MESDKRQIYIIISITLAVLGVIFLSYAYILPSSPYDKVTDLSTSVAQAASEATSVSTTAEVKFPLNINTATADELMMISGIGEKRAYAIIEYREYLGGYTSVEQIRDIQGISEGVYAQIAGYLTV